MPIRLLRCAACLLLLLISVPVALAQPAAGAPSDGRANYGAIADILEDEASRRVLIEDLRRLAAGEGIGQPAEPVAEPSFAQRVAGFTRGIAEMAASEVSSVYAQLTQQDRRAAMRGFNGQAMLALAGVIVVVIVVFVLGRWAARLVFRRFSEQYAVPPTDLRGRARRWVAVFGCGLLDLAIVLVAWVVGYAAALLIAGDGTQMNTRQSLFLNAFLVVEIVKVVARLLFARRYSGLRLLPVQDEDAAYWYTWISRLISLLGYGILVVVPVVALDFGRPMAAGTSLLVYLLAFVVSVIIVRQNRDQFSRFLEDHARQPDATYQNVALSTFARIWHVVAIIYLAVLFGMLYLRPETALTFIAAATIQSIVAIGAGLFLSIALGKAIRLGIHLPAERKKQFPLLEERLNAFVPTTLKVVRVMIAIAVVAIVLDAWSIFDTFGWLASETGTAILGRLISVAMILVVAALIWLVASSWIEYRLREDLEVGKGASARERTLLSIFRNAFTIGLVVITAMITLSELGLNIGPLLAGAGVLGLAIGFGAQKLVQDVITGIFIQLENAMNTGDVVTAGPVTGVVEKLTVRSVGIRDLSGTYHLIPFSSVDTVSNFMKGFSFHVGEYGVAYRESVDEVVAVLKQAFEELRSNPDHAAVILGEMEVHGVTALADSSVNVRIRIKTLPGKQWALGRDFNGLVKKHFDAAGIEIPYPHMTVYFGEDKKGKAPAAPIRFVDASLPGLQAAPEAADTGGPESKPRKTRRGRKGASPVEGPDIPSEEEV